MPLKLGGQGIDMRPLQGRFIEAGFRGAMVSDHIECRAGENPKRLGLDIRKGCLGGNPVI
jgi:hypothetical protein